MTNWTCENCGESIEVRFKKCWSCGSFIDGSEDPEFSTADEQEVRPPESSFEERIPGLWVLALLIGGMALYMAGRQRSTLSALISAIAFGYVTLHATAWWLVRSANRSRKLD